MWVCLWVCVWVWVWVWMWVRRWLSGARMRLSPRTKSLSEAHGSRHPTREAEVLVAVVERWRGGWDWGWGGI